MRRTSALFSTALFLALAVTLISRDPQTDPRLKKASRAAERSGWIQVHLEGSPAEIGYQHGYLLAAEIQDNFRVISTEMTHEEKKDWAFFRKAAEEMFWPRVEPEYRDELNGIVEGLKARNSKLDLWDIVALNAWLEMPYYFRWYNQRTPGDRGRRRSRRPLQRVRRHRQLHEGRAHRHRAQQLDQLFIGRAVEHHLRHRAGKRPPHPDGRRARA